MKYINEIFKTNSSGYLTIVKYVNAKEVYVKFIATGFETKAEISQIRKGCVKDKLIPSVYSMGVTGDEVTKINGTHIKEYQIWSAVLERCYDYKFKEKNPTYADCTASKNFLLFAYFKEWCNNQIGFGNEGWHLDKDILVKGNKVYSEDTCCFVPKEINNLFVKCKAARGSLPIGVHYHRQNDKYQAQIHVNGRVKYLGTFNTPEEAFYTYKEAKEQHIKDVATKWRDKIDPRVYEALTNWVIEITD